MMTEQEKRLFDSVLDGLRRSGWSRQDAEDEALEKVLTLRRKQDAITTHEDQ